MTPQTLTTGNSTTIAQADDARIREAAILAGVICADEILSTSTLAEFRLILREMRAETETLRLARRIAAHCQTTVPSDLKD